MQGRKSIAIADVGQGFAESYMLGEVSSPDLTKFFEVRDKD